MVSAEQDLVGVAGVDLHGLSVDCGGITSDSSSDLSLTDTESFRFLTRLALHCKYKYNH